MRHSEFGIGASGSGTERIRAATRCDRAGSSARALAWSISTLLSGLGSIILPDLLRYDASVKPPIDPRIVENPHTRAEALHQTLLGRPSAYLGARLKSETAQDMFDVVFRSTFGDLQSSGDLLVCEALRDQYSHLPLARGQWRSPIFF